MREQPPFTDDTDTTTWRPRLFEPTEPQDATALADLLASGRVTAVHDRIDEQLAELARCLDPGRPIDDPATAAAELLAGRERWQHGVWAWYPWTGRLVHVLPRADFRLVRTDRNRGRISRAEQAELLRRRIAVIGLSVGNSAALTCAMEGVGGAFRLADHADVGLSNLNRLRTTVADLGVPKTVICARQMYEIDPYLHIEIENDGVTEHTVDEFFTGGTGPIDLLVEECDTPWVKIAAREHARALRIPVLMGTDDRGMLDVERFDLEPNRPLLHGRLGGIASGDARGLDRRARLDLLLHMVDESRLSPAMADAIPKIGQTLSSWPQLASGALLGGALVTDTARRVLLGRHVPSGRYHLDLDTHITGARDLVSAG